MKKFNEDHEHELETSLKNLEEKKNQEVKFIITDQNNLNKAGRKNSKNESSL